MEIIIIALLAVLLLLAGQRVNVLRHRLAEARRSEHIKTAFMRSIAQEAATPLEGIRKVATVLTKDDLYLSKNEKRSMADQLLYNADLIHTFAEEVIALADAGAEGHTLRDEQFSPNALCRRCLAAASHNPNRPAGVKLSFRRDLSDEFFVTSDRHIVELILNKLILNACRFTEQGEVAVGCDTTSHAGYLTLSVSDTGGGTPAVLLRDLLECFERPADERDAAELDLCICRRLAEKLGGELVSDMAYRQGTRMQLLLPLK